MAKQQDGTRLVLNVDARAHCSPTHTEGANEQFNTLCDPVGVIPVLQDGEHKDASSCCCSAVLHGMADAACAHLWLSCALKLVPCTTMHAAEAKSAASVLSVVLWFCR
jgi:hypothetical protein